MLMEWIYDLEEKTPFLDGLYWSKYNFTSRKPDVQFWIFYHE